MIDDAVLQEALAVCPTPLYVFDQRVLNDQIAYLRASLPAHVKLCYAMKANPFIVREASFLVDCIEACSPGELHICASAGVPFEKIVLSGVWKDRRCLEDLFQAGCIPHRFTIESSRQLEDLVELASKYRRSASVLFRLSSENQFGIDFATLKELVGSCKDHPLINVRGVQYYSGTQKASLKKIDRELTRLHRAVVEVKAACSVELDEIEYGPGFPVEYFDGDEQRVERAQDAPVAELAVLLGSFPFKGDVVLELGRRIAADCGTYLTSVVDAKTTNGQNYAIVDGGMHQISYYGHSMAMRCPVFKKVGTATGVSQPWNICGALCTVNDIIAKQAPVVDLSVGDVLAFARAGAYCVTEGRALFLSRDLPSVIVRDALGDMHVVRHRLETAPLNSSKRLQASATKQDQKEN